MTDRDFVTHDGGHGKPRLAEIVRRHAAPTNGPWDTSRGTISGYIVQARDDVQWLLEENERLRRALGEIAEHVVVSEGEYPDDNCDWHCTLTMQARAKDALDA